MLILKLKISISKLHWFDTAEIRRRPVNYRVQYITASCNGFQTVLRGTNIKGVRSWITMGFADFTRTCIGNTNGAITFQESTRKHRLMTKIDSCCSCDLVSSWNRWHHVLQRLRPQIIDKSTSYQQTHQTLCIFVVDVARWSGLVEIWALITS